MLGTGIENNSRDDWVAKRKSTVKDLSEYTWFTGNTESISGYVVTFHEKEYVISGYALGFSNFFCKISPENSELREIINDREQFMSYWYNLFNDDIYPLLESLVFWSDIDIRFCYQDKDGLQKLRQVLLEWRCFLNSVLTKEPLAWKCLCIDIIRHDADCTSYITNSQHSNTTVNSASWVVRKRYMDTIVPRNNAFIHDFDDLYIVTKNVWADCPDKESFCLLANFMVNGDGLSIFVDPRSDMPVRMYSGNGGNEEVRTTKR
ncbi:MAG: hypothetical protein LBH00_01185 [Planctomycetaceae bacterium]|jgi:hypothetical protein|nr:hypothetical protein [Planctomycetaceae bacterium]